MNFLYLPLEIKLKILSYLPQKDLLRVAGACRSFRDAAYHPVLWKSVKVHGECSRGKFVDSFASFVLRVGALLEELDVELNNSDDSQRLFKVALELPNLKALKLYFPKGTELRVSESIIRSALFRFGNIESLQVLLDGKYRIRLRAPKMEFLKHLKIQCMELNDISPMLEKCSRLETISVRSQMLLCRECTFMTHFRHFYQTLTTVELTNVTIKGEQLSCLKDCTGLTVLRIYFIRDFEDDHFRVLKCFKCLIILDLTVPVGNLLTKTAILQLFSGSEMKNLKVLCLPWMPIDDECVRSIALCCSNLETVSLLCKGDRELCRSILEDCERLKNVFLMSGF